jgi:hypothetical protein
VKELSDLTSQAYHDTYRYIEVFQLRGGPLDILRGGWPTQERMFKYFLYLCLTPSMKLTPSMIRIFCNMLNFHMIAQYGNFVPVYSSCLVASSADISPCEPGRKKVAGRSPAEEASCLAT